jgi:hypothetical protein
MWPEEARLPPEPAMEGHLEPAIHIAAVTQLRHDTFGRIYRDKQIAESRHRKKRSCH